jgi:hypothetical protein
MDKEDAIVTIESLDVKPEELDKMRSDLGMAISTFHKAIDKRVLKNEECSDLTWVINALMDIAKRFDNWGWNSRTHLNPSHSAFNIDYSDAHRRWEDGIKKKTGVKKKSYLRKIEEKGDE